MKSGYAITTYKMQLNYRHLDWIQKTNALFNDVSAFYYSLLEHEENLLEKTNQNLLRHLEIKTIKQRDGTPPEVELPFKKVPLYFRRAAINTAISLFRTYVGELKTYETLKAKAEETGKIYKHSRPNPPKAINASMLYYKGMYKEFEDKSILLKLYSGKSWVWVKHHFTGRPFPENVETMSPTIVVNHKKVMLHVPVKETVEDTRTAKERVQQNEKFCSVALTGSDTLAVCTILNTDGSATHPYFIKGGKKLAHRRKQLLGYTKRTISKNIPPRGRGLEEIVVEEEIMDVFLGQHDDSSKSGHILKKNEENKQNQNYYKKITAVSDHYAHDVSRKIVDHAVKHGAKIIVLPDLEESITYHQKAYLGNNTFTFIGRRIIEYTRYKAWQKGIVTMASRPYYASSRCYHCGEDIKKYNKQSQNPSKNFYGGKNFICLGGHKGSTHLNTARNLGKTFYEAFYKAS